MGARRHSPKVTDVVMKSLGRHVEFIPHLPLWVEDLVPMRNGRALEICEYAELIGGKFSNSRADVCFLPFPRAHRDGRLKFPYCCGHLVWPFKIYFLLIKEL